MSEIMETKGGPMAKLSNAEVAQILYDYMEDPNGDAELYHAIEHGLRSADISDATLQAMWSAAEDAFDVFEAAKGPLCDWIHAQHCPCHDHLH